MIKTLILAFVQGVTEFIPVSSSGHLALLGRFFTPEPTDFSLMVFLHGGSLLSVLVFFRHDLRALFSDILGKSKHRPADRKIFSGAGLGARKYLAAILLGTLPVALLALPLRSRASEAFVNPSTVGAIMLVTAAWLALPSLLPTGRKRLVPGRALLIGCAQAVALFPGISRSGSTIATGLFCGLSREEAFRFSFLLSLPAVGAAFAWETFEMARGQALPGAAHLAAGTLVSFLAGLAALHLLRKTVISGRLTFFSIYLVIVGLSALIFF